MEIVKQKSRTEIYEIATKANLIPVMPSDVQAVFNTLFSPMIKECDAIRLANEVNDGLAKAFIIMGLNAKGEASEVVAERKALVNLICEDFKKHWATFSLKEIGLFFELFGKGFLGDFKLISQQTISQAMMKYWSKDARVQALKAFFEIEQQVLNPKAILTEEDKDSIFKEKMLERFDQFAQAFRMNPNINSVKNGFVDYDYLDKKALITFDEETKQKYWKEAIEWVNKTQKDNSNPEKATPATKSIVQMIAKDSKAFTIMVAKEMLLCHAYKKLINKGRDLKELL